MKTLIIYASKKGTTRDCAMIIKEELKADIIDLKANNRPDISQYGLIIMGTPLYIGRPVKKMIKFCTNYLNTLEKKKIAFFLCGIGEGKEMIATFKKVIPSSLVNKAITINHFGGEFRIDKSNFFEKKILQKIIEENKLNPQINKNEINNFIKIIRGQNEKNT